MTDTGRRRDVLAVLGLLALTVAFFWKLILTNLVLVGLDVFAYFYPYREYASEWLRRGHVPLWNPYLFMGVPLLANIQAAVLYPINVALAWLPAPRLVSVSIALHVFLAGAFTYAFARRSLRLPAFGSFLAAAVFALGGFLGAQVEHVNQLNVTAWLPLLLLLMDVAWPRPAGGTSARVPFRPGPALLGSVVVALMVLAGHTQAMYISLSTVGLYLVLSSSGAGLSPSKNEGDWRGGLTLAALRVASYAGVVLVGALLSMVQLLPTLELAGLSFRSGGLPYREAASFSLRPQALLQSLLPPYGLDLSQVFGESFSEYVAYLGILGLLLAAIGWAFGRSRGRHAFGLLAVVGVFLAFGLFNPAYYVLYRLVPGFALFRAPVRWLLLYHFGLSILVGYGADALLQADCGAHACASVLALRRKLASRGVAPFALISFAALLVLAAVAYVVVRPARAMLPIWIVVLAVELGLIGAALRLRLPPRVMQAGLAVLLLAELFVGSRGLAYNNPTAPQAYDFLRTATAHLLTDPGLHRFISLSNTTYDPGDLQQIREIYGPQLSPRTLYDYVITVKRNEVQAFNLPLRYRLQAVDGYDGGLLPLKRFVEMEGLFLPPALVSPDGRLREQLKQVPDSRLLSLLNVKYIITDKVYDVWVDNVFYDLQFTARLSKTRPEIGTEDVPDDPATALGVISYLQGCADVADGTPVAEIVTVDDLGVTSRHVLRAGQETAEGDYSVAPVRHAQARVGHHWRDDPSGNDYVAEFEFDGPRTLRQVTVRSLLPAGEFDLRGLSLIDRRTQSNRTVLLSTSGRFRLVHSGDVKIYENLDNLPRAFVVHDARVIADDAATIEAMRQPDFDPARTVILPAPAMPAAAAPAADNVDQAEVVTYEPERVVIRTQSGADGYLVLTDSYYPCWEATVDGQAAPILRANFTFRAVELPAGEHRVEFIYRPRWVRIGAEISGAAALVLAVVWIGLAIRRNRQKA